MAVTIQGTPKRTGFTSVRSVPTGAISGYTTAAGDIIAVWARAGTSTATSTPPSGWAYPAGFTGAISSGGHAETCVLHTVTSAEETAATNSWTITNLWDSSQTGAVYVAAIRGTDTVNFVDSSNSATGGPTSTHVLAGLTGSNLADNSLVLSCVVGDSTQTYSTAPAGWTFQVKSAATQNTGALLSRDALTVSGTDVTATNISASSSCRYASITIAFAQPGSVSYSGSASLSVSPTTFAGGEILGHPSGDAQLQVGVTTSASASLSSHGHADASTTVPVVFDASATIFLGSHVKTFPTDFVDNSPTGRKVDADYLNGLGGTVNQAQLDLAAKYIKPSPGIPEGDLSPNVQAKLNGTVSISAGVSLGSIMEPPKGTFPAAALTLTMQTTEPTYTSKKMYNWDTDSDRFRVGGEMYLNSSGTGPITCGVNGVSGADYTSLYCWTGYEVEFWCLGTDCAVHLRAFDTSDYKVMVDDMHVTGPATWPHFPSGTGRRYLQFKFTDGAAAHKIRVFNGQNGFIGVSCPGTGDIFRAAPRRKCAITGDSYIQGPGPLATGGPIMAAPGGVIAALTGWEVWNFGQGTTGYIQTGSGGNRSEFGSAARLSKLNAHGPYDVIIVFGGGNDSNETPSHVASVAEVMWDAIKASWPDAALIVVGVQTPDLFPEAGMTGVNTALRNAAIASSSVDKWVDMREPTYWVTDQTKDIFIVNEFPASIHPTHAGYDMIWDRVFRQIRPIFLP